MGGDFYNRSGPTRSSPRSRPASGGGGFYSRAVKAPTEALKKKGGGPSVFSRVMDVLSRGQYISAGLADAVVKQAQGKSLANKRGENKTLGDAWDNFYAAASGEDKHSYSQVMKDAGVKNKAVLGIGGFAGDVLLDPTTYVGAGAVKTALKPLATGASKADDILRLASKTDDAAEVVSKGSRAPGPLHAPFVPKAGERAVETLAAATKAREAARLTEEAAKAAKAVKTARKPLAKGVDAKKLLEQLQAAQKAKGAVKLGPEAEAAAKLIAGSSKASQASKMGDEILKRMDDAARQSDEAAQGATKGADALPVGVVGASAATKIPTVAEKAVQASLFGDDLLDVGKAADKAGTVIPTASKAASAASGASGAAPKVGALDDLAEPVRRALELRYLGKSVVRSEKAYDIGKAALSPVKNSMVGRTLSQTFRNAHGMTPAAHNLSRIFSGRGRQDVTTKLKEVQGVMDGIVDGAKVGEKVSVKDQKKIFEAVQNDTVDLLDPNIQFAAKYFQKELANLASPSAAGRGVETGAKFSELEKYKGAVHADGSKKIWDRAPQAFLHQYDRAIRKQYFDEFAKEAGKRWPNNPEVVGDMKKIREVFGIDGEVSAQWKHIADSIQGPWKKWVTQIRPGFHTRNMLGDAVNSMVLAGSNPSRMKDAAMVLGRSHGKKSAEGVIKVGGKRAPKSFTPGEIEALYRKGGLETSWVDTEVVGRGGGFATGKAHKVADKLTDLSQSREKYMRLTTFIDSLDRGLRAGKSLDETVEMASGRVRKYHFDYTDLTPQERKLRTFIPFYTYTRKELPLLLEHTLTSPGRVVATSKGATAVERMLGVDRNDDDAFPGGIDALIPEYLKDKQNIHRKNGKVFTPGLPTDLLSNLGPRSFVKNQTDAISPLIKAPWELSRGKTISGFDIKKKDQSGSEANLRYGASYGPYGTLARDNDTSISSRVLNIMHGMGSKDLGIGKEKPTSKKAPAKTSKTTRRTSTTRRAPTKRSSFYER